MDFFFFQSFFNNLSRNFIPPLISNLNYFKLDDIEDSLHLFDDDLTINYTLMGAKVANASIDKEPPLINIGDGDFKFAFSNLNINLTSDYKFMSDPPILADIGEVNLTLANTTISTDVRTYLHAGKVEGSKLTVDFSDTSVESEPMPFCNLTGINDFSQIMNN